MKLPRDLSAAELVQRKRSMWPNDESHIPKKVKPNTHTNNTTKRSHDRPPQETTGCVSRNLGQVIRLKKNLAPRKLPRPNTNPTTKPITMPKPLSAFHPAHKLQKNGVVKEHMLKNSTPVITTLRHHDSTTKLS
jgi:hypothetical protein